MRHPLSPKETKRHPANAYRLQPWTKNLSEPCRNPRREGGASFHRHDDCPPGSPCGCICHVALERLPMTKAQLADAVDNLYGKN